MKSVAQILKKMMFRKRGLLRNPRDTQEIREKKAQLRRQGRKKIAEEQKRAARTHATPLQLQRAHVRRVLNHDYRKFTEPQLNVDFLHKNSTFMNFPSFSLLRHPFPEYKKRVEPRIPNWFYVLFGLGSLYLGALIGEECSTKQDMSVYLQKYTSLQQVHSHLIHDKKPVFVIFYAPGQLVSLKFLQQAQIQNKQWKDKQEVVLMKCSCKDHLDFCRQHLVHLPNVMPQATLFRIKEEPNQEEEPRSMPKIQTIDYYDYEREREGIVGFLQKHGYYKDRSLDVPSVLEDGGAAYMKLMDRMH